MTKQITSQAEWHAVADELDAEQLKIQSYDRTILERLGSVAGRRTLDYGCGPGVLALALQRLGAESHAFDINPEMCAKTAEKIEKGRVYRRVQDIRSDVFDIVTCNLVLCIVDEGEVRTIAEETRRILSKNGIALFGFCNPQIFDIPETQLDVRFSTGNTYWEHHTIPKIKKEGSYRIFDNVRPISWYHNVFYEAGLEQTGLVTTPPYTMPDSDRVIRDFVIFEQTRQ